MITIQIAHVNIQLNLIHEDEFYNLQDYQAKEEAQYTICSCLDCIDFPQEEPTRKTEYYDLYIRPNETIQVQKNKQIVLGMIYYRGKTITLYLFQNDFVTEYLLSQYALLYILNQQKNALFIHGSSIVYHTKGILFSAKSGTGKSTQARLWRTYTDAEPLNDDKNIIVYEEGHLTLYSNPWSGKHQIHQNITAPLSCIVFLYQAKDNHVERLSPKDAMRLLLGQIEPPRKDIVDSWNQMIDLVLNLPIYFYGCTMEEDAVTTLKERLEKDLCL